VPSSAQAVRGYAASVGQKQIDAGRSDLAVGTGKRNSLEKELLRIGVFAFTVSTRCVAKSVDAAEIPS
jgi:hypothetical protein